MWSVKNGDRFLCSFWSQLELFGPPGAGWYTPHSTNYTHYDCLAYIRVNISIILWQFLCAIIVFHNIITMNIETPSYITIMKRSHSIEKYYFINTNPSLSSCHGDTRYEIEGEHVTRTCQFWPNKCLVSSNHIIPWMPSQMSRGRRWWNFVMHFWNKFRTKDFIVYCEPPYAEGGVSEGTEMLLRMTGQILINSRLSGTLDVSLLGK